MPTADVRAAARLFATGGNGAIYYGLGVTEHSQGTTTVMAIAKRDVHHIPSPDDAGERDHHRLLRLGHTAVQVTPSNGPTARQEEYQRHSEASRQVLAEAD